MPVAGNVTQLADRPAPARLGELGAALDAMLVAAAPLGRVPRHGDRRPRSRGRIDLPLGAQPALPRRRRPGGESPLTSSPSATTPTSPSSPRPTEGAAFERADALLLAIGTGIGSAVLSDGRIVRGSHGAAASFGWACADVADPGDDRHGWLERHAAGPVLDAAGAAMTPPVDGRGLVAAAIAGDVAAQAAIDRVGTTLGTALAGAVALLDPGLVIISGGLADAVDVLAPSLRAALLSPAAGAPARHRGRERRTRAIGRARRRSRRGAVAGADWWQVSG